MDKIGFKAYPMSWLVVRGENAQRDTGRNNMSSKHWPASYGQKIPCEIDPNAHGSVLDLLEGMLPNIPAFAIAMIGIVRAGAVQVNVNPLYTPRELEHQLNDAGVETIVIFNGVSSTLAEIVGKTPVKQVISVAP